MNLTRPPDVYKKLTNPTKIEIKKHSAIIQMSNNITAQQRKAFNALLYVARKTIKQQPNTQTFRIDLSTLKVLAGINATDNKKIKKALRELVRIIVEYNILSKDKKEIWGAFSMLAGIEIENGIAEFHFPIQIHRTISRPELYAALDLSIIKGLVSKYSIALYELLKDYKNIGKLTIDTDDFRALIGAKESYKDFHMLKKRVLEVAVEELNSKTDIKVSYNLHTSGSRKITEIEFLIGINEERLIHLLNESDSSQFLFSSLPKEGEEEQQTSLAKLIRKGITKHVAEELVTNATSDKIEEWLQHYEFIQANNKTAFLIKAIREGWQVNERIKESAKQQQVIAKETDERQSAKELKSAFQAHYRSQLDKCLENLNKEEEDKLKDTFLESIQGDRTLYSAFKVHGFSSAMIAAHFRLFLAKKFLNVEDYDLTEYLKARGHRLTQTPHPLTKRT